MRKWASRALRLGSAQLPASVGTSLYNVQAVSVLGFVRQLLPPPRMLPTWELAAGNRLLHFPPRSPSLPLLHRLKDFGMLNVRSATSSCLGALARTAVAGSIDWSTAWDAMMASAEELLPMSAVARGCPWGTHWTEPAFAAHLRAAAGGRLLGSPPPRFAEAFSAAMASLASAPSA